MGVRHPGAARELITDAIGRPLDELELGTDERGRPLVRVPGVPPQISIAHTNDLTLVAIARGVEVGVDVERLDRQVTEWALWGQVLTADETARLPGDRWARNVALLWSWVRREAILKAAGVGLALEPRTIELGLGGEIIALPPVLGAVGRWGLVDLEVPGCAAAVAVRSESALASVAVQLGEGRSLDLCPLVTAGA